MKKILIVEDERNVATALEIPLKSEELIAAIRGAFGETPALCGTG